MENQISLSHQLHIDLKKKHAVLWSKVYQEIFLEHKFIINWFLLTNAKIEI